MTDKAIPERQQYWLDRLKTAEARGTSLAKYAKANDPIVKDLCCKSRAFCPNYCDRRMADTELLVNQIQHLQPIR